MSNKAFPRARRIAQQIQQTLSELIRRELRDPRLGMITLTEVRVSKDLSYAKVFFSVLGAQPQQAQEILEAAGPILRGPLGRALGIRHSPEPRLVRDALIESAARLPDRNPQAAQGDAAAPGDAATQP